MTQTIQIAGPFATEADMQAAIAERLRRGADVDQLADVGERTGWWTADDVDWVFDGHAGPRPRSKPWQPTAAPSPSTLPVSADLLIDALPDAEADTEPAGQPDAEVDDDLVDELDDGPADVADFVLEVARPELAAIAEQSAASQRRWTTVAGPVDEAVTGFVAGQLAREAAASTALDGETHVLDDATALTDGEPAGPYATVLQLTDLFVDHTYQRPLDAGRIRRMADAWNPRLVGLLDVSDRGPATDPVNRYAIVNGQHRAAAAARAGVTHVACNVHDGLDVAAEAALMHELDRTTKKLTGHDQWRARRTAGDPAVATVERVAAAHGLTIAPQRADGVLTSYGAAEKLLQRGGEQLLHNTLAVLRGAYGLTAAAWQAPLVSGVGQLLTEHPDADVDRLTRALADITPTQLRAQATTVREIYAGTLAESMTSVITGLYNRTSGPGPRLVGGRA